MASQIVSDKDPESLFDIIEILGEGSYGVVYKAKNKTNGIIYAIKVVNVEDDISEVLKEIFFRGCHDGRQGASGVVAG